MKIGADDTDRFGLKDGDPHDRIAQLEAKLEELAEAKARCRKLKLVSQIALAGGGMWMLAATIGVTVFDPVAMLMAIAGVIGGIVLYGSNATTAEQIDAAIEDAEERRADLIERLDLRLVGD